jgi:hypothetical protein
MSDFLAGLDARAVFVAAAVWLAATVLTVGVVALVVVNLPPTHFVRDASPRATPRDAGGWLRLVARNLVGLALILLGAALSLPGVPGQGVLTMLIGAMLLDVPGRRRLERWLVGRPGVLAALNRLRARWGKPALLPPEDGRGRCP